MKKSYILLLISFLLGSFLFMQSLWAEGGVIFPLTLGGEDLSENWSTKTKWFEKISSDPSFFNPPQHVTDHFYESHSGNLPVLGCASFFDPTCQCETYNVQPWFNGGYAWVSGGCYGDMTS